MNDTERHIRFWKRYRGLAKTLVHMRLNFEAEEFETPDGPYLVMANHATDFDPLMLAACFPKHMYFLASEHVYRMGFLSTLVRRYCAPITRTKGASDLSAVKSMLSTLRSGQSVAFFPSGMRTFNGESVPILPAAAKLAIKAGVPLLTVRLTGGYLTTPRWAKTARKGKTSASLVHVYEPSEMKAMGAEALTVRISEDLYVNDYEEQRRAPVPFLGKNLADGISETLYRCPVCGGIDTIRAGGDTFSCACGLKARLDEYGFLVPPDAPFTGEDADTACAANTFPPFADPLEWDHWQLRTLETDVRMRLSAPSHETAEAPPDDSTVFTDEHFVLSILEEGAEKEVERGTLAMGVSSLTIGSYTFPFRALEGFSIIHNRGIESLVFSSQGIHYQLSTVSAVSRYKYYSLWTILQTI